MVAPRYRAPGADLLESTYAHSNYGTIAVCADPNNCSQRFIIDAIARRIGSSAREKASITPPRSSGSRFWFSLNFPSAGRDVRVSDAAGRQPRERTGQVLAHRDFKLDFGGETRLSGRDPRRLRSRTASCAMGSRN